MVLLAIGTIVSAQNDYHITVESKKPAGIIDEMLYGQLFEHIYFSANNGVWQELIQPLYLLFLGRNKTLPRLIIVKYTDFGYATRRLFVKYFDFFSRGI